MRVPAQAAAVKAAEPAPKTEEEKRRIRSAVVLLSILSGIALSGLLLIIAAVAIRGLQRKLAGPTRLDREPADMFPAIAPRPELDMPTPASSTSDIDPATQETQHT